MSRAIPMFVRKGKNTPSIYAQIRNGNVYKLNAPVSDAHVAKAIDKIKAAGWINLKHWTKAGTAKRGTLRVGGAA